MNYLKIPSVITWDIVRNIDENSWLEIDWDGLSENL